MLKEHHIDPTLKYGGGSDMIWGCMTTEGVGYMCRIDDRIDSQLYTEILDDRLFQSVILKKVHLYFNMAMIQNTLRN